MLLLTAKHARIQTMQSKEQVLIESGDHASIFDAITERAKKAKENLFINADIFKNKNEVIKHLKSKGFYVSEKTFKQVYSYTLHKEIYEYILNSYTDAKKADIVKNFIQPEKAVIACLEELIDQRLIKEIPVPTADTYYKATSTQTNPELILITW